MAEFGEKDTTLRFVELVRPAGGHKVIPGHMKQEVIEMAYVRVVPQIDWEIIRKYLDDETLENTAILISEEAAAVSGTDVFDRKLVLNPYEDGNHDVSLYLIGNPQNEILSELKLDDE